MIDIKCAADFSYFVTTAVRSHVDPWMRMDNIEDYLIRLVKPYDEGALQEKGFGWACNANWGKGRAKVESDVAQNVADVINSLGFMRFEFRSFKPKDKKNKKLAFLQDDNLRTRFADTFVNIFIDTLEKDNYTGSFVNRTEYCTYTFGHCSVTRDMFGYLGYANHPRSIAYEDRTQISNIRNFILFDVVKAEFLYNELVELNEFKPEDLKQVQANDPIGSGVDNSPLTSANSYTYTISEKGWIKEGLVEVFRRALIDRPENIKDTDDQGRKQYFSMFESWQDIKAFVDRYGMSTLFTNVNNVFLAKAYYFDRDNNYIEVYAAVSGDVLSRGVPIPQTYKYLLYKKNHGKRLINKVINVIRESTLNVNDWIHELKGAGKMIAEDSLRYDMKKCKLEDRLTLLGCVLLKTNSEFTSGQLRMMVMGGIVVPESGVQFDDSPFKVDLSPFINSMQFDEQGFARETQHLAPDVSSQLHNRATKDEVQAVSQETARMAGSKVPLKFKDYSVVFHNAILDLVNNDAMSDQNQELQDYFFDSCIESISDLGDFTRADIKEIINCISEVRFTPVIKDITALKEAMELTGNSEQRSRLQKMLLMALGFTRRDVNELVEAQDYGEQVSIAAIENDMFFRTTEVAFGPTQDHITHLQTHYAKADRVIQGIAQGQDIVQGFNFLTNCLTNCQSHLAELQDSYFYEDKYKEFVKVQKYLTSKLIQIAQLIQKMRQQQAAQQQQAQQQAQPQIDPKTQASIYNDRIKMMDKMKRTEILTQDARQRKMQEFATKLQLLQAETDAKIGRESQLAEIKKNIINLQASLLAVKNGQSQQAQNTETVPVNADTTQAA